MFLQRKVALFSRTTRFLFGNALYSINKYEHNMKMLFKLIAKWSNINLEIPFLIEVFPFDIYIYKQMLTNPFLL